jgi:hypothetical protein
MTIRLTIDRIVVDPAAAAGADPRDLRAALETELGRLVAEGGVEPFVGGSSARERVAAAPLEPAARGDGRTGLGLARSLYGSLLP